MMYRPFIFKDTTDVPGIHTSTYPVIYCVLNTFVQMRISKFQKPLYTYVITTLNTDRWNISLLLSIRRPVYSARLICTIQNFLPQLFSWQQCHSTSKQKSRIKRIKHSRRKLVYPSLNIFRVPFEPSNNRKGGQYSSILVQELSHFFYESA